MLQTLTPLVELEVLAAPAALLIHPPLPPPFRPILPQFLTPGLRTSPPESDHLETPTLVSGPQRLGLVLPSKTQQGSQFGLRATPRAGLSPWLLSPACMLNHFSRVRLFATPWTRAHQASPSMGFFRQECWSRCHFLLQGLLSHQFTRSVVSNSLQPHEPQHARLSYLSPTPKAYSNSCPLSH